MESFTGYRMSGNDQEADFINLNPATISLWHHGPKTVPDVDRRRRKELPDARIRDFFLVMDVLDRDLESASRENA